jgi:hypothetical protein
MPRCGRTARSAVSRPVCADEKNPALSVDRKHLGTSTIGSRPARSAPAVAPHDPPRSADACRSAIGRPILWRPTTPGGPIVALVPRHHHGLHPGHHHGRIFSECLKVEPRQVKRPGRGRIGQVSWGREGGTCLAAIRLVAVRSGDTSWMRRSATTASGTAGREITRTIFFAIRLPVSVRRYRICTTSPSSRWPRRLNVSMSIEYSNDATEPSAKTALSPEGCAEPAV